MQSVDIYAINAFETDCMRFVPLMSKARLKKLSSYINEQAKILSAAAELMLNVALKSRVPRHAAPADYFYDALGKPTLFPSYGYCISVAHSGELALCAISALPVGLDAEKLRIPHGGLKYRLLSERELAAYPNPDPEALIDLWSAKESYLKLTGEGLRTPMSSFSALGGEIIGNNGLRLGYTKKVACHDLPYSISVSTFRPADAVLHLCTEADLLPLIPTFYQNMP